MALAAGQAAPFAGVLVPGPRYARQLELAADGQIARAGGLPLTRGQTWTLVALYGVTVSIQAYQAVRRR